MTARMAAINFGESMAYRLDHLLPLCDFFHMPLFTDDEQAFSLVRRYYPKQMLTFLSEKESLAVLADYDALFVSDKYTARDLSILIQSLFNKKMRFIYCPHGNSDKGLSCLQMNQFLFQDMALIYGKQMLERLKKLHILSRLQAVIPMGNVRKQYYLLHQNFFEQTVRTFLFKNFSEKKYTLIYAPSWEDEEKSSSFDVICLHLIKTLPDDCRLIVKLHPFLKKFSPGKITSILERFKDRKDVIFLPDIPLVYPILNLCDIYIGDFSSIGYDFLWFNRPMFFVDPYPKMRKDRESKYLFQCGIEIPSTAFKNPYPFIFAHMQKNLQLKEVREDIYNYVFDKDSDVNILRQKILDSL